MCTLKPTASTNGTQNAFTLGVTRPLVHTEGYTVVAWE